MSDMAGVSRGSPAAPGLLFEGIEAWMNAYPCFPGEDGGNQEVFERDAKDLSRYLQAGARLLDRLPPKPRRDEREASTAEQLKEQARSIRTAFLRVYAEQVYRTLTDDYRTYIRADDLVYRAAERFPGLTPSRETVRVESSQPQRDKEGAEIDQGIFFSLMLGHPHAGAHLVHAMLRPRSESLDQLTDFRHEGKIDLGTAVVERRGRAGYLSLQNPRFLNAEDDSTTDALEIGVDLILLDPEIEVGVLRGGTVDHPRYQDRHIFSAGINLTHLYHGKISYLSAPPALCRRSPGAPRDPLRPAAPGWHT